MSNQPSLITGLLNHTAPSRAKLCAAGLALAFMASSHSAKAASGTWTGATSATWAGANWSAAPVPGSGDIATFNNTTGGFTTIDLGGGVTINTVIFNAAAAYTIGAGAVGSQKLTLNNGGAITVNSNTVNNELFNAALVLGDDGSTQTFTFINNSATNSLTVAGGITGSTGAGVKTLAVAGAGNTVLSGTIGNGTTGTVALTKSGAGTLTLSGSNSYTGGTTINGGVLSISNDNQLGGTGVSNGITINGGTLLGTSAITFNANHPITIGANGGTMKSSAANGGDFVFNTANTLSGAGALLIQGTTGGGTDGFLINAAQNLSGPVTLNGVRLALGNAAATFGTSDIYESNGNSEIYVGAGVTLSNRIYLAGSNSDGRGAMRISAGSTFSGNLVVNGAASISQDAAITSTFSNAISGGGTVTFGGITGANGSAVYALTGDSTINNMTIGSGIVQLGNGSTGGTLSTNTILIDNGTFQINRSNAVVQGTDFASNITGTGGLTLLGTNTVTLSGVNTFSGATTLAAGNTLVLNSALADAGSTIAPGTGTIRFADGGTAYTVGGLTGSSNLSIGTQNGTSFTLSLGNVTNTYTGVLSDGTSSGTAGLTKIGAGQFILGKAATYTGLTTVDQGNLFSYTVAGNVSSLKLDFNNASAPVTNLISSSSTLWLGGDVSSNATTILGGGQLTLAGKNNTNNSQAFTGNTTIGTGWSQVIVANTATSNNLSVNLNGITRQAGGVVDFTLNANGTNSATNGIATSAGAASSLLVDGNGTAYATVGGNDWAAKDAGNNFIVSLPTVSAYTASTAGTTAPGSTANVDFQANNTTSWNTQTINSLRDNTLAAVTLTMASGQTLTVATGGVLAGSALTNGFTITGGSINAGAGKELVFDDNISTSAKFFTINSVIADSVSGTSSVTYRASNAVQGGGEFQVGAQNTYTGPTYIVGGRVFNIAANTQPLGNGGNVFINGNTNGQFYNAANVTIANHFYISGNGWNESGGFLGAIRMQTGTLSGQITLLGNATIGSSGGTGTFGGVIDDGGNGYNLTLNGGTTILTNAETYTGMTTITNGSTLQLGNGTTDGSINNTNVNGSGTLNFNNVTSSGNVTYTGRLNGVTVTKSQAGTLTLNNGNNLVTTLNLANAGAIIDIGSNNLTISNNGGSTIQSNTGGTVNASGGGTITLSQLSLTDGADIGTATGTTLTINANIIGGSALETWSATTGNNATGVLVLTGTNTYTGNTIIHGDVLSVASIGNRGSTTSNLGQGTMIDFGLGSSSTGTLKYTGSGETSDRIINLQGSTAGGIIDASGTSGLLKFTSDLTVETAGAKTLTLQGSGLGEFAGKLIDSTSGATALTKGGTGTWTLSGANTYTGTTTVSAGTLAISGAGTLGSGAPLTMGGGTLDLGATTQTVGAASITTAGSLIQNGNLSGTSYAASLTSGTATVSANLLANGSAGLTMSGAGGTLALSGSNTYTGATTISAGTLSVGSSSNLGGTSADNSLVFNGGTLQVTGTAMTSFGSHTPTFTATKLVALDINNTANNFTISQALNQTTGGLTKLGAGTLTLSGSNSYTGQTTVSAGTLNYSGTLSSAGQINVGVSGGGNAVMNVLSGANINMGSGNSVFVGAGTSVSSGPGFVYQSGGTLQGGSQVSGGAGYDKLYIGGAGQGSYGYYNMSGGSLNFSELDLAAGDASYNGTGFGVMDMSGGTASVGQGSPTNNGWLIVNRDVGSGGIGILNLTGGTLTFTGPAGQFANNWGTNGTAIINIGNAMLSATNANINLNFGSNGSNGSSTNFGEINLLTGGTLQANSITSSAAGTRMVNFNGGTLKASTANTTFLSTNLGSVNVFGNGGTIDNNGVAITIPIALIGGSGTGVSSVAITNAGAGYLGAPAVTFTGGGGSGAAGYAIINSGTISQIVITNPGTGYTSAPMVAFTGGGATTGATATSGTAANTSGGMTFQGTGATTLSGANTYSGGTLVSAGTLIAGVSNVSSTSGAFGPSADAVTLGAPSGTLNASVLTGGAFNVSNPITVAAVTSGTLSIGGNTTSSGTFSGTVTLDNNLSVTQVSGGTTNLTGNFTSGTSAAVTLTFNNAGTASQSTGVIGGGTGAIAVTQAGSGTTTLSGANTYTGATIVNAGILSTNLLANGGANSGIGASGTGAANLILNGGTLQYTGGTVSTDRLFSLQSSSTIDASGSGAVNFTNTGSMGFNGGTAAKTLTLTGTNTGSNTVAAVIGDNTGATSLTKSGAGTWVLSGANTYSGATSINGGMLQISGSNNLGNGSATNTISFNGGTLESTANTYDLGSNRAITLNGAGTIQSDAGTLTISGAITNGANLLTVQGAGNTTISGVIGSGAGGVTKTGAGTLLLSGSNTYTGTTTISAGTLANGSANTFTNKGTLTMNNTGAFDLGGFNAGFTNFVTGSGTANTITNSGSSDATLNLSAMTVGYAGLVKDGATNKTAISMANSNAATLLFTNTNNTFSGGITLLNNATGTRLYINSAISSTGSPGSLTAGNFGTGTITIGQSATDKAGIRFDTGSANDTLPNAIVFNTALGTDLPGISNTVAGITLSGAITANSAAEFDTTASAATTTVTGTISGAGGVIAAGSGTVTLSASNTYGGATTISGGILSTNLLANGGANSGIGASGTGAANLILNGGTLQYTGGTVSTDRVFSLQSSSTIDASGSGPVNFTNTGSMGFNGGTAAKTLTLTGTNTGSNTLAAVIGDNTLATSLTKSGAGTWVLSGANTYTGATTVSAGTLSVSGAINNGNTAGAAALTVANSAANAVLNISGTVNDNSGNLAVGTVNGASGVVNINGGTLKTTGEIDLGNGPNATAAFGALVVNSGTFNDGSYLAIGRASGATGTSRGEFINNGGTVNVQAHNLEVGSFQNTVASTSIATLTGGTTTVGISSASGGNALIGNSANGVLNMSGGASLNVTNTASMLELGVAAGVTGIANLDGGTVTTPKVAMGSGTAILNFNGGTLKANVANGSFMTGLTNAYVYSGGGTIDNGNVNITIGQALTSATGNGVNLGAGSTLAVSGSGFIAAPIIDISGGGGTGATAIATIDSNGNLTGVTITNPGVGYTGAPTFTFTGGGSTVTQSGTATLLANTSGSLTFQGSGATTLSGANTYSGSTAVTTGTLQVGNGSAGSLSNSSALSVSGGATLGFDEANGASQTQDIADAGTLAGAEGSGIVDTLGGAISGVGVFTQTGAGTTVLSGSNGYSGGTTISAGALEFSATNAMPSSGTVTTSSAATLIIGVGGANQFTSATSGAGSIGGILSGTGGQGAPVTFASGAFLGIDTTGGNVTYAGNITNSLVPGLTKLGVNTLALSGSNTYAGPTTISAGTLEFDGTAAMSSASALTVNDGATISLRADTSAIFKPASYTFAGTTNILVNGLTTGSNQTLTIANNVATNPGSNTTINVSSTSGGTLAFGSQFYNSQNGSSAWGGNATTFNLTNANVFLNGATAADGGIIVNGTGGSLTIAGNVGDNGSGARTEFAQVNTGTLILADTFNGASGGGNWGFAVYVNGGTLDLNSANALNSDAATSGHGSTLATIELYNCVLNNTSGAALTESTNPTLAIDGTNITFGTVSSTGSNSLNLGSGGIALNFSPTITLLGSGTLTLGGAIASSANGITVTGSDTGTLNLSGFNAYTGGSIVNGGILEFTNTNSMPSSGTVTANSGGTLAAAIGGAGQFTTATSGAGSIGGLLAGVGGQGAPVTWASGAALGVDTTAASGTYAGVISNPGGNVLGLTKLGSNTLTLTATNTYTGLTTINAGTLTIGGSGDLGSGSYAGNIANSGTFNYNGSAAQTLSGTISGAGALTLGASAGTLALTGSNSYTGGTTINGGTLQINSAYSLGASSGAVKMNNGTTLEALNGFTTSRNFSVSGDPTIQVDSGTYEIDGVITNGTSSGELVKTGAGTLTLSASNSYSGGTAINGGILNFAANALGSGSITFGGGTLQYAAGNIQDVSGQIGASGSAIAINTGANTVTFATGLGNGNTGGLTKGGSGTLYLASNSNAYGGTTTVNQGTLIVSGQLTGSDPVVVNSGGTLAGGGQITGSVTVNQGGTIAPGAGLNTVGTEMFLGNDLNLSGSGSANVAFNLDGTSNNSDSLWVGGNLSIGGSDTLTLTVLGMPTVPTSETYIIAYYGQISGSLSGTFARANIILNGTPSTFESIDYNYQGGDDIAVTVAVIPEPGTCAMMLAGTGLLIAFQRARRRRI